MEESNVIDREEFGQTSIESKGEKRDDNYVPCFVLIPSFNFFQLYLIGVGYLPFSNRLFAQQGTDKYEESDIKDGDKKFFLNNHWTNISVINRKKNFEFIIKNHLYEVFKSDTENKTENNTENNIENEYFHEIEDKLFDRKKVIDEISHLEQFMACPRKTDFVNLDNKNDLESKRNIIIDKLKNVESYTCFPVLFHTNGIPSQFNYPLKVLMQKEYKFKEKNDKKLIELFKKKNSDISKAEDVHRIFSKKIDNYFQISFIIGTKLGIPVLILFSGESAVKIYDNKSEMVKSEQELKESLDIIYMLYYSIDGLNCDIPLKNKASLKNKTIHGQINMQSDLILEDFIKYKYDNFWKDNEFNFIQLVQESVMYPALFGYCSGCDAESSYIGSVILGTDTDSGTSIINSIKPEIQTKVRSFVQTYGNFTIFTNILPKFLMAVKKEDFQSISNLAMFLFAAIPAQNKVFFDLFVKFMLSVIDDLPSKSDASKTIKQYLYSTVEEKDRLKLDGVSSDTGAFAQMFSLKQHGKQKKSPSTSYEELKQLEETYPQYFQSKHKLQEFFKPEYVPIYTQDKNFQHFLASTYYQSEIVI